MLSNRSQSILPSPTLAVNAKVAKLKSDGLDIINLGVGEPDFNTPVNIKAAAINAINGNYSHYTPTAGIVDLRIAISEKFKKDNNIDYSANEVIVGTGSKQLLYNAFQVLCNPGDEVLVATPTWATYIEQIKLSGAKPIEMNIPMPFVLNADTIEKYINKKTKAIILNSPSNPTGAVIPENELRKIADIAVNNGIWIVSDEIYEKIIYGKRHFSIASIDERVKAKTITINGLSKAYAMTGWRLGFAGGPKEVIDAMSTLQDQETSNPSSIVQYAAIEALTGSQKSIRLMRDAFEERRDFVCSFLSNTKGIDFSIPDGAFYLFVYIKDLLMDKYSSSEKWCEALLEQEHVALTPGEAFLAPNYFRLSYASSMENLKIALERILKFIDN